MFESKVLVGEFLAVYRLATRTVAPGEVTALAHELRDDAVEGAALKAETLLARAERTKVFCCNSGSGSIN